MDYIYKAKIVRVIDGDTLEMMVDLGFSVWINQSLRLYGINAPETRTKDPVEKAAGLVSKQWLQDQVSAAKDVQLKSISVDKYGGRFDGILYLDGRDINKEMLDKGLAKPFMV